jgi:Flavin-binding monooxygenase-like
MALSLTLQKTIAVGNAASGVDIVSHIAPYAKPPLLQSVRSVSPLAALGLPKNVEEVPQIVQFLPESRGVRFENGRVETNIDTILFCTGYLYTLPFLESVQPKLITDGRRVRNLYRHMIYRHHPTLALVGLPQKVSPFITTEGQAAVIARVWSGRLTLPSIDVMAKDEAETQARRGDDNKFHYFAPPPADSDLLRELRDWSDSAEKEGEGIGKKPGVWSERQIWQRKRLHLIKKAFESKGKERHSITTVEELGFDFEAWKRGDPQSDPEQGNIGDTPNVKGSGKPIDKKASKLA